MKKPFQINFFLKIDLLFFVDFLKGFWIWTLRSDKSDLGLDSYRITSIRSATLFFSNTICLISTFSNQENSIIIFKNSLSEAVPALQELSMEVLKEARIHGVDLYEEYQRSESLRSILNERKFAPLRHLKTEQT